MSFEQKIIFERADKIREVYGDLSIVYLEIESLITELGWIVQYNKRK